MSDTNTSIANAVTVPTGAQIYDALMAKIEPELLSGNIPHLDEPYANETPEHRTMRYKRYEQAYAAYDRAYDAWLKELHASVQSFRRTALQQAEAESRQKEADAIQSLEEKFGTEEPAPPSA